MPLLRTILAATRMAIRRAAATACATLLVGLAGVPALHAAQAPFGLDVRPTVQPYLGMPAAPNDPTLPAGAITTQIAFPNLAFQGAVFMCQAPRSNLMYVCEREGRLWSFDRSDPDVAQKLLVLDLHTQCQGWDDCGMMGLAFHPEFGDPASPNRDYFYVYYQYSPAPLNVAQTPGGDGVHRPNSTTQAWNRLSRFTMATDGAGNRTAGIATEQVLINQYDRHLWHNGGGMFFHPGDHFLYLSNGDEGASDDSYQNTQRIDKGLLSGVLRIDVDYDPAVDPLTLPQAVRERSHAPPRQPLGGNAANPDSYTAHYGIPDSNPFVGLPNVLEEFYALGLRSPHRMTHDAATGTTWLGDIGQGSREEIDLIVKGGNYQWAYREGTQHFNSVATPAPYQLSHAGGYPAGATTLAVGGGKGQFAAGELVRFGGAGTVYTVAATTGFPVTTLTIIPALDGAVADATTVVKTTGYTVTGATANPAGTNTTVIPVAAGTPAMPLAPRDAVIFPGVAGTYTITALSGSPTSSLTVTPSLASAVAIGAAINRNTVIGLERPPLLDFDRSLSAIIGGYVYRGSSLPELYGRYVFGDNPTGKVYTLDPTLGSPTATFLCNVAADYQTFNANGYRGLSSFAVDSDGELYLLRMQAVNGDTATSTGRIYKLVHNPGMMTPTAYLPQHLSGTGAFMPDADGGVASLTPSPALVPYAVNAPLWSDGAQKQRWIALPNPSGKTGAFGPGEMVQFQASGEWGFPAGTVFVKHFELEVDERTHARRRLETRVLVRTPAPASDVYGVTYKWRPDGREADLLSTSVNEDIQVTLADGSIRTQTWYYPGRGDCLVCHNSNAHYVLGVKSRQLNGDLAYPGGTTDNQLRTWNHLGMFDTEVDATVIAGLLRTVPVGDATASLEARARSFVDANCAHCHRPGGVNGATWDARFDTPLAGQGIVDEPAQNALGIADARIVAHNDLGRSVLYQRDDSLDPGIKMPPLAKNRLDDQAMEVLRQWIATLRAPATVSLAGLAQTYDGAPKPVAASTSPAGRPLLISYAGSAVPPTAAGSYAVVATIDTSVDMEYGGNASGTLVIAKATAAVSIGALAQTYDGTARAVSVATAPAGLGVAVTYDGSPTPPVAAGAYAVQAAIVDPNYRGVAAAQLTIAPATATVTLGDLVQSFDGTPRPVSATTSPAGLGVSVSYDGSSTVPSAVGTYAVMATVTDANHAGSASGTLTIKAMPAIAIADASIGEGDSGSRSVSFTVTLSDASTGIVTVQYATADGTATAGADYVSSSGTLTFAPGVTSRTVAVTVLGDLLDEADETFTVALSTPVNATIATATGTGTIVDDDPPPGLAIGDVYRIEGDAGATDALFAVTLSAPSGRTVTVAYASADGTASAGSDYTAVGGVLSFAPGATACTIPVAISGDLANEPDETFTVTLTGAAGATITRAQGTGTIGDDDSQPILAIDDVQVAEDDDGATTATFTLVLSAPSGQAVSVDYATADGTATAGADYVATSGTIVFPPGTVSRTIAVAVLGDVLDEDDETFTVELGNPLHAALAATRATGTILDDDPLPALAIGGATVAEGDAGSTPAGFTVTMSAPSGRIVTVGFATADGTATAGADYTAAGGTLTFAPGETVQRIDVAVLGDLVHEADETFTVHLGSAAHATIAQADGIGAIVDDDPAPPAGQGPPPATADHGAGGGCGLGHGVASLALLLLSTLLRLRSRRDGPSAGSASGERTEAGVP